jgi:tetratricopeptide (TPR) repeat protein
VAAVVVGLWLARNRLGRGPLVAVLFFCGTLFPALGFVDVYPFRYSFVADHFQYLASIGLLALGLSVIAGRTAAWSRAYRGAAHVAAAMLLVLLGIATWDQSRDYRDVESLWVATLRKNPQSWMAHNNLGKLVAGQDRLDEAIEHFRAAIRLRPDNDKAYHNLGVALSRQGRNGEALEAYSEAVRINPQNSGAQVNFGNVLAGMGRYEEAAAHYAAALRILPDSAEVHNNLANALAGQGRYDAAIEHYEAALRIDPDYAAARENLSVARELRRDAEAVDR